MSSPSTWTSEAAARPTLANSSVIWWPRLRRCQVSMPLRSRCNSRRKWRVCAPQVQVVGAPATPSTAVLRLITPRYFDTLGVAITGGRSLRRDGHRDDVPCGDGERLVRSGHSARETIRRLAVDRVIGQGPCHDRRHGPRPQPRWGTRQARVICFCESGRAGRRISPRACASAIRSRFALLWRVARVRLHRRCRSIESGRCLNSWSPLVP